MPKICIAGKNNIAVEIVDYILREKILDKEDIFIIANKNDNGIDTWQRSLLKYSNEKKLNVVSLKNIYNVENLIFLSLEFDRIIKPYKFKTKYLYNIHFSLLPKYKGMYTSILPILNNEKYSGVTLHYIDKGIDTGDIIEQVKFELSENDNSRDLYFKYTKNGIDLIKRNLQDLVNHNLPKRMKQDVYLSTYYSKKSIDFSNIQIDLNQTAISIHNQIRAYNFREYQQPIVFGNKIISSKIIKSSSKKVGKIIFENDISLVLGTIDNDIILYKDLSKDFFEACKIGDLETINNLIQIPKLVNVQNENGWTPLIIAIYNNNIDVVKTLLINGADVNITNFNGTTILMYAKSSFVINKDDGLLKLILNLGVDKYKKDFNQKDVFDYCVENNELEAIMLLKKEGR